MMNDPHQKVQASHLKRNAYVYVRQSTLRQVLENTESTKRQYGLRQRAVALGWAEERVIVIDSDLGQSGASSDREGFQRLVSEVGMGHAGIDARAPPSPWPSPVACRRRACLCVRKIDSDTSRTGANASDGVRTASAPSGCRDPVSRNRDSRNSDSKTGRGRP